MKHLLFSIRLFLYLLAFAIPLIHPAIAVPYDRIGFCFYFLLIPAEILIAYFLAPPRLSVKTWLIIAGAPVLVFILFISGINRDSPLFAGGAAAVFLLTVLIFKTGVSAVSFVEQFFLGFLYYKILSFSRASESTAAQSSGITQLLLVIVILTFLLHGLILYLCRFHRNNEKKGRKEIILFLVLIIPVSLVIILLLPPDFVKHSMVFNPINKDIEPKPVFIRDSGEGVEGGNLLPEDVTEGDTGGNEEGEKGKASEANRLEGISADQWDKMGAGIGGKQYAVMVVSSPVDPVYAAGAYFGRFDPVKGFLLSKEETLNELSYIRLLETWKDEKAPADRNRHPADIYYLSTLPSRFLAYRPFAVEPTVMKSKFHPFDFSYNTISRISWSQKRDWHAVRALSNTERETLKSYLHIPLPDSCRPSFETHLKQAVGDKTGYYEQIEAILKSFSEFQYELGFDDNVFVKKLEDFLVHTKQGDCSEFSNCAAILSRLAGIPSRVVTGYLASKSLQTPSHKRGILVLREAIKPLQKYPLKNLYLVTTAHRHSWVQFYMPGYGWLDFETTAYAIPPPPGGDPNSMDVVIPLIQGDNPDEHVFDFPWLFFMKLLFFVAAGCLVIVYLYRYTEEIYLKLVARGDNLKALNALFKLILIHLSLNGYKIKRPWQTPVEYSVQNPALNSFASLYTMLRFRENFYPGEKDLCWQKLRDSYNKIIKTCRKPGFINQLKRAFNLRSLYYR